MQYFLLSIKGIAIGAANVVPGVSGATLTVILRLYDSLIGAINSFFSDTKNALKFLIPFGIGMAIGILAFVSILDFFLINYSLQTGALIAGLMAGSIPFLHKTAMSQDAKKPYYYVISVIFAVLIICMTIFTPTPEVYSDVTLTFGLAIFLFVGGIISAGALIVPGVSGAMVLIILGLFPVAIHTLNLIREYIMTPFNFSLLPPIISIAAPIGIGVIVGLLITSRLVAFLLEKFHGITYFAIIGLVMGTVFALFSDDATYQSHAEITPVLLVSAAIMFVVGVIVSLMLGKK